MRRCSKRGWGLDLNTTLTVQGRDPNPSSKGPSSPTSDIQLGAPTHLGRRGAPAEAGRPQTLPRAAEGATGRGGRPLWPGHSWCWSRCPLLPKPFGGELGAGQDSKGSRSLGASAKRQARGVPALVLGSKRGQRVSKETLTNLFTSQQTPAASPRHSPCSPSSRPNWGPASSSPQIFPNREVSCPPPACRAHCSSLAPFPVPPHLALTSILQVASGWKN